MMGSLGSRALVTEPRLSVFRRLYSINTELILGMDTSVQVPLCGRLVGVWVGDAPGLSMRAQFTYEIEDGGYRTVLFQMRLVDHLIPIDYQFIADVSGGDLPLYVYGKQGSP